MSAVGFSPDGDVLATAGTDSTVQLWDVADPHSPQRIGDAINDPMGRVYDLSFHPDGHLLAAGVTDGSVWVWDIRQPAEPQALAALGPIDDPVYAIAFSPRGDVLVAGGTDGRIRSWRLDEAAIMHHICRSVGDLITEDQWAVYLPTEPYDPPCR